MRFLFVIVSYFIAFNVYSQSDSTSFLYPSDKYSFLPFFNQEYRAFEMDTNSFYTNANYNIQYGKAQAFGLKYKHQLNTFVDFQLNLIKFSREGLFKNEEVKNHELDVLFNFSNKLDNYHSNFHFGSEKYLFEENGGLVDYDNLSTIDPILFSVELDQAKNTGHNHYFSYNQSYQIAENLKFANYSNYYYKYRIFEDSNPNPNYYPNIFLDSLNTFDSTYYSVFNNQLALKYSNISLRYHYKKQSSWQLSSDSTLIDHGLSFSTSHKWSAYEFDFYADYFKSSTYNGVLSVNNPDSSFVVELSSEKPLISIFTNRYSSNHFHFKTNFNDYKKHKALLLYSKDNFKLSSSLTFYDNFIYLNQQQKFDQQEGIFYYSNSKLDYRWKWRLFNANHSITYQFSTNEHVFRVPNLIFFTDIFINPILFDSSLDFKIGSSVSYFSSYYSNAYSPVLGLTYLQNNQLIGNFPFLTFYTKFSVESVNIEFQLANIYDILSESTYYLSPNIPYFQTPFQLSINWQLD